MSPIPFTAVVEYARLYGVGDFHEFLDVIREMDSELLQLENKKQSTQTKKNSDGNKTGKRDNNSR
jgi:hypothetical protein